MNINGTGSYNGKGRFYVTYIKDRSILLPTEGFAAEAIWNSLMASLENMWKACQVRMLDYSGYSIAPGLVDTHIHGFGGVDVMDNNIRRHSLHPP